MEGVTDRFKDAPWIDPNITVIVGGAGGIGSWLTLLLSRAGYEVYLFDDDTFETHNMGGQFVNNSGIGQPKVQVVKDLCEDFGCTGAVNTFNEKFTSDNYGHNYMMGAFDNMEARKTMFDKWFSYNSAQENSDALFIDGRLTMEQLQILCVGPINTKQYREEHLFNDEEVPDTVCTLKQTSHSAAMIASHMVGFFTNHIANIKNKNNARSVPFQYEYYIPINLQNDKF